MKIEAGRYYKTRDGRKVGPMEPLETESVYAMTDGDETWTMEGKYSAYQCDMALDLIAEWTDAPDLSNPLGQVLGLMPPETQEAMKAHGGPYERYMHGDWCAMIYRDWHSDIAYRVKPAPIRKTVTLYFRLDERAYQERLDNDTHRFIVPLIDGKPDCASIKMEELE
jgi:hypothetical protein